jgi:hypothetical protein
MKLWTSNGTRICDCALGNCPIGKARAGCSQPTFQHPLGLAFKMHIWHWYKSLLEAQTACVVPLWIKDTQVWCHAAVRMPCVCHYSSAVRLKSENTCIPILGAKSDSSASQPALSTTTTIREIKNYQGRETGIEALVLLLGACSQLHPKKSVTSPFLMLLNTPSRASWRCPKQPAAPPDGFSGSGPQSGFAAATMRGWGGNGGFFQHTGIALSVKLPAASIHRRTSQQRVV